MVELVFFVFCLLCMGRELYAADSNTNKPSIQLLEFLGKWQTQDGQWIDPLWFSDKSQKNNQTGKKASQEKKGEKDE